MRSTNHGIIRKKLRNKTYLVVEVDQHSSWYYTKKEKSGPTVVVDRVVWIFSHTGHGNLLRGKRDNA